MKANLRILALNWRCLRHPQAGGSEVYIFEQARRWVQQGHSVTVVCADPGRAVAPQRDEIIDGIEVLRMGGRFSMYLWVAWFLLRSSANYDRIVDIANGIPFFSPLFSRTPGVLVVHHVHGQQWFTEFPFLAAAIGSRIERYVVPLVYRFRSVIAVSPTTADALVATGFDSAAISMVLNGVAAPIAARSTPHASGTRMVYIGRLKRYKRVDHLIRALHALRAHIPDVYLDIVGEGDARPDIEALANTLGVRDAVVFHGFVDEQTKADIFQAASVFATASMHEGWGLSVIEANTYSCPAVAYDVPGLRSAIRHGQTGLLADTEQSFQDALKRVLTEPGLHQTLSEGARQWAATFSWDSTAVATLEVVYACSATQPTQLPA